MSTEMKNTNNYVELQGYLCKDIEIKETKNGKKEANIMLNVWKGKDAEGKNEYMVTYVKAYGEKAEEFAKTFKKEQLIGIIGRHSSSLDEEHGYNRSIIANDIYAVDLSKEDKGNSNLSILQGFVCKDIELSETKNGKTVANIMLNVKQGKTKDENGVEKDKYVPIFLKAYGDKAKGFAENYKKGELVEIKGRVSSDYNIDKVTHKYNEDIIVGEISKLERQAKKETTKEEPAKEGQAAKEEPKKEAPKKTAVKKAPAKKKETEAERG